MPRNALLVVVVFSLVCSSCARPIAAPPARADSNASLAALFDEYWQLYLQENPSRATYLGDHRYDDRLEDLSEAARRAALDARRALLARIRPFEAAALREADRLNLRLFARTLEDDLYELDAPSRFLPIRQQYGPHIALVLLKLSQPLATVDECRRYAARLSAFPTQVDDAIAQMRAGMAARIVQPRIIIEKSLPGIEKQLVDDPTRSELFSAYAEKHANRTDPVRVATEAEMLAATRRAIDGYRRLATFLKSEYLPACRETVGIGHLPGGPAWYAAAARYHTTTNKSPQDMHQIGLDELRRIHAGMREIAARVGFVGDLPAFFAELRGRADQHFTSADEMMRAFEAVLRVSDANLPKLFGRLPKTSYRLKEIEAFRAPVAPAAYYYQAPDEGDRPAYFYVNTYQPAQRPRFTMEALAYHEAMPGHHLQIALAQENPALPQFRRHASFTVFIEGWALYSEVLGHDLGGYRDPYQEFGRLTFDAWRASRLVVDTGLHALGWTRTQAIEFMQANTSLAAIDIESEIDRYIAWPGQALAYKIGQLEIARMRRESEARLGPRFDIRDFHDTLLSEGALPLDLLQERMTAWLERRAAGGRS